MERKHFEKVQKMRENLLADITEKFNKLETNIFEKNLKCSNVRENNLENSTEKKKITR